MNRILLIISLVACQEQESSVQGDGSAVSQGNYYGLFRLTSSQTRKTMMDLAVQIAHRDNKPQLLKIIVLATDASATISSDQHPYHYDEQRIVTSDLELVNNIYYRATGIAGYQVNFIWSAKGADPLVHVVIGDGDNPKNIWAYHQLLTAMGNKVDLEAAEVEARYFTAPVVNRETSHSGRYRLVGKNRRSGAYDLTLELINEIPQNLTVTAVVTGRDVEIPLSANIDQTYRGQQNSNYYTVLWQNKQLKLFTIVPIVDDNENGLVYIRGSAGYQLPAPAN